MGFQYEPPTIRQLTPYPHVPNPQTGEPFRAPAIAALHRRLFDELLGTAERFLAHEAGLELPDWLRIADSAHELADFCLFDSLTVAQAQLEPETTPGEVA